MSPAPRIPTVLDHCAIYLSYTSSHESCSKDTDCNGPLCYLPVLYQLPWVLLQEYRLSWTTVLFTWAIQLPLVLLQEYRLYWTTVLFTWAIPVPMSPAPRIPTVLNHCGIYLCYTSSHESCSKNTDCIGPVCRFSKLILLALSLTVKQRNQTLHKF